MRCPTLLVVLLLLAAAPAAHAQGCAYRLFISGYFSNNVAVHDACNGQYLRQLETAGRIRGAQTVRLNPINGLIYVVSEGNDQIQRYRNNASLDFVDVFAQLAANIDPTGIDFGADGRVYVASYGTSRVIELDRTTGQVLGDVLPAGNGVVGVDNGMMVSVAGLLYVPGYDSHNVARVNPATGKVQGDFIPTGSGGLRNARGILDEGATILVTGEGSGAVYRYNAATGAFVSRLVSGLTRPTGMAIGTDAALLVLWGNRVRKYDPGTGAELGILASGVDGGISGGTFLAVLPVAANDVVFRNGFDPGG